MKQNANRIYKITLQSNIETSILHEYNVHIDAMQIFRCDHNSLTNEMGKSSVKYLQIKRPPTVSYTFFKNAI